MGKLLTDTTFSFTPDQRDQLKQLRKLVEKSNELQIGTEDVMLSKFLHHTNWDVTQAFEAIQHYYDFKSRNPKWLACKPVRRFRDLFYSTNSRFLMPKPDKDGRLIVVIRAVDISDKYPNYMNDLIQLDDLIYESLLLLPRVQQHGLTIINDLTGTTRNTLRILTPTNARLISEKANIAPCKRVIHLIQKGMLSNVTISLIFPFLTKELKKHIYTHEARNFDKLRSMVGYENLPYGLGGPPENVLNPNMLYKHLLRHEDYLLKLQAYKKRVH